ncbi:MAG: alpha/beta hydrolase [Bacteroidota bacterium]|nr:alpha/beta hydrolase [Bacteroidota bacterium]
MTTNTGNIIIDGSDNRPILIDVTKLAKTNPKEVIVFSHGFKGFKDWGPFNNIAKEFALRGFAFVKFNFSHNGTTIDNPINFTDLDAFGNNNFCKELDDVGFVLDWVEKNLHSDTIYLLGHSRGGGISILKTAEDDRIKKVVSWASPADFSIGISADRNVSWKEKGVVFVYNGRTKQNMPMYYQFYENCQENRNRIDIKSVVKKLNIPQLIIHGSCDTTVKISNAKDLKRWNDSAELSIINGADHVFGGFHPFNLRELPLHLKEAIKTTSNFLER